MKYIVVLTIDRHPPGTDVTDLYTPDQLQELVRFGYLEEAPAKEAKQVAKEAAEKSEEERQAEYLAKQPEPAPKRKRQRKEGD